MAQQAGPAVLPLRLMAESLWCAAIDLEKTMSDHDTKQNFKTYEGAFMALVKWGTPIFAILMLIVVFFTTR
jgi:hypothetical protein